MNTSNPKRILSESEEKVLVRYLDGETGFVGSMRAKWLIATVPAAAELLETMRSIGEIARNERLGILERDPQPVDLWSRVSSRIHEEERAALYLGGRPEQNEDKDEGLGAWFRPVNLAWGFSGGALAAVVTSVVLLTGIVEPQKISNSSGTALSSNALLQRVSSGTRVTARHIPRNSENVIEAQNRVPVPLSESRIPTAVEVDWVKSNGRVRMMQEPNERSAVIWVKRRNSLEDLYPRERSSDREPLVVYGDRIPQSIPVVNRR